MHPALTTKDLAQELCVCPRTATRWWKRLRVPPDVITVKGCHRWSRAAADKLKKKWLAAGGKPSLPAPRREIRVGYLLKKWADWQGKKSEWRQGQTFPEFWTNK